LRYGFEIIPKFSRRPVNGLTVFTDASKNSHQAGYVWHHSGQWHSQRLTGEVTDSLQTLELYAVLEVLRNWSAEPVNVVCDSLYVVGIVQRLEHAVLKEVNNRRLSQRLT
ncbi:POK19 protein, partial [Ibidorhyncha struthersii]|nr:POK19 protein [Ibidorhyncha struthersii]